MRTERARALALAFALGAGLSAPAPAAAGGAADGQARGPGVIAADASWSGVVTITGPLVVKKGATLTILPGTTVRFAWVDGNADGIGDGELTVEGRLVARGTRELPIRFTSARERPGPKDWTYVMINFARESVVERCVFEHAFTGLQVHFSNVVVRNNVFRDNFEALRFSTADVRIERNEIAGNAYGIRYESRGSAGLVSGNRIVGNEYGFFPVVKSSSSVRIAGNCVESRGYNVKVGEEQREDLDFRGNWWGSPDPERIEEGFFDRHREPALGRVLYQPFLEQPSEECGVER